MLQGVNVMLKGNHKHDNTNLDSSVMMRFGKGQPIESSLHLSDRTTELLDVSGLFTLNYPGRQIVVNETIRQPEPFKYVSDFNGQFQKGQTNSVLTSFTQKSPFIGRIDADVHMHEDKPYQVDVEWSTEPTEFYTRGSYQKGVNRYAGSLTSVNIPNLYRLVTEVEVPQRHMKLALEGKPTADIWSGAAELDLNVDKQNSQRITLSGWLEPLKTLNRINGSVSLTYPQRTLTLNAHNIIGSKVTSHADFSWEKNKQIDADFIYGSGDTGKSKQIVSKIKITTPFEMMKRVSIDLTHADAYDEYKTELDLKWQPHSIATTAIVRKPLSLRTIVGSIETSTSFKAVRKLRFDINHKLSDSLASAAKLSWNKMFVQTEITLVNQTKPSKTAYKGDINIKTSFPVMKKGVLSISHSNNGITFTSNADFLRNRKKYGLTSEITHQPSYPGLINTGSLTLFCPHGKSVTDWSHRNSENDIATVFSTKWGNAKKLTQEIFFKAHGNMFMEEYSGSVNGSVELITPFSPLTDIQVVLSHAHAGMKYYSRKTFIDSSFKVLKDKRNIASIEVLRKNPPRELTSYVIVTIPDLDVDSSFKIIGRDLKEPEDDADAYISFELVITPEISGSLLLKAMFDKAFHSAIEFKSTIPGYRQITYTYDAHLDKFMKETDQLSIVRRLHYDDGKIIEIGTKFVFARDLIRTLLEIKTPYDSLQKFEGNVVFTSTDMHYMESFTWDSYIEVQPHFDKISQSVSWDTKQGIEGKLRVDSPFNELSNLEANVKYEDTNRFMQGSVGLDYSSTALPHYPVQIDVSSDYLNYDMSAKMSTPVYIELSHKGNLDNFNCKAEFGLQPGRKDYGFDLGYKNLDKIEGSVTISIPSRRDISGYFSHSGTITSFATHAEILHNRKNQLLSDFSFNSNGDLSLTSSVSLKSDILQLPDEYEVEFRHEGWPRNFKTHAEFSTANLGKTESDVSFDTRNDIQGSLLLKSPSMKNILSSFNLHTRSDYLQARADYTYGGKKEIDFLATVDTSDVFIGEVSLTSPFSQHVKGLARVNGQIDNFMAYTELFHGSDKSEVDISFSLKPKLHGSFSLKTPYMPDVSSEFDHTGTFPNIQTQAKLGYSGKDQFKVVISLSTESKMIGAISVETPFTDFETLKLEVSHEGQLKNFRCHGEVVINEDKTEADLFYSSLGKYEGLASLKSHLFQDLSVGFEHSGTYTSFKSHVEYTIGFVKTEGDISLDIGDEIDVSLRVRSPNIDEHQVTYNHKGTYDDFNCHAVYTHGFSRKEMTLKVDSKDSPKLDFTITAPELTLNLNHAGHVSNFQSHGDVTFDGEKRVADISLRVGDKVDGSVIVTAPMFSLKLSQYGDLLNFVSNIEIVKDYDRYESQARLSTKNGIEANLLLNSPIDGYEKIKAQYTHDGSFRNLNFKCHGELSVPDSLSVTDLKVNLETAFEGSFSLSSPVIPDINAEFDHSMTTNMYKSHAEVSVDHDVMAGITMSLDHSAGLDGDILLQTPFNGYRNIRSSGRYSGTLQSFSLHHEVLLGTDRHEIDVNYDSKPKHLGSLSIRTPMLPEIDADFNFAGQLSKIDGNTKVLVDGIKKFGVSGAMDVKDGVNVDFDIVTPIENFTRIEGQLKQTGYGKNMQHDAQFSIEGRKIFKTNAQLSDSNKISASGSIKSVFFEPVKANVEYQGTINDFTSSGEIFLNDEKWTGIKLSNTGEFPNIKSSVKLTYENDDYSLSTDLNNSYQTSGKMTISLPIQGWEHTDISIVHEGSLPNVKTSAKIDFASGTDIEIVTEHDQIGLTDIYKFYLMSPYTDEIDMSFNHTGGLSYNFDNSFELRISQDIRINSENSLKTGPDYVSYSFINKALMSGETFTQKITFNHGGNLANFKTDALVSLMDKYVQMDTSFQLEPVLEGSVALQSSIEAIRDIKAGFSHNGNQHGFMTTGEVQYSTDNKIEGKVDFTNHGWRRMVTDIEVKTPFKGYDFNRISYEHKGDSESFQCDGEVLVGEKKVTGTITGSKSPLSLGINIHTPFEDFEKLTFNGNVDIDQRGRYSSRVETSWNPANLVVIDGSLTALNRNQLIEGSMSVSSPFEVMNKLNVDFTHRELSDKYMESLKVGYNGKNLVDVELDDSLFQTSKTAALTVRSPRPMKFEIDGEFSLESSNAELTANWNNEDPSSNLNIIAGYDFRPRLSDKTVNFKLTGPAQKITYSGSLDLENQHSKSDLTWGDYSDQKVGYDITLKRTDTRAKVILPTRSIELTGSNRGRITEGSVMWDADNDQMKKVGFRSVIVPSADSIKADVTLMLPSLGKVRPIF